MNITKELFSQSLNQEIDIINDVLPHSLNHQVNVSVEKYPRSKQEDNHSCQGIGT